MWPTVFSFFESDVLAFPGILNWQHRIWLCLNEFNKARIDDTIVKPEANSIDYENEDLRLLELRNSCVSKADNFYSNAHFSAAIKECQELTDELRVSENTTLNLISCYQSVYETIFEFSHRNSRNKPSSIMCSMNDVWPIFSSCFHL